MSHSVADFGTGLNLDLFQKSHIEYEIGRSVTEVSKKGKELKTMCAAKVAEIKGHMEAFKAKLATYQAAAGEVPVGAMGGMNSDMEYGSKYAEYGVPSKRYSYAQISKCGGYGSADNKNAFIALDQSSQAASKAKCEAMEAYNDCCYSLKDAVRDICAIDKFVVVLDDNKTYKMPARSMMALVTNTNRNLTKI